MNKWLTYSPFLAVGIYISGNSRACRDQPNLTPEWISTQLAKGWRLLPITLGPQASCQPRFPRYQDDPKINPKRGTDGLYQWARAQGTAEATKTVTDAQALGIVPGSTLWYDLEGFDDGLTDCRESALAFLSTWTDRLHALGYKSGVYSSAGSGIEMLDDARVERPGQFSLPDAIWIARWDLQANTSTSYIRDDGWLPGGRMKQYQGGHDETWGGVRINIDRNYLDLGLGSYAARETHCGGTRISYWRYPAVNPGDASKVVPALQCLLKEKGAVRRPDLRHVRRGDRRRRPGLDELTGPRRAAQVRPAALGLAAERGRQAGAQDRLGRPRRTPPPARPVRRRQRRRRSPRRASTTSPPTPRSAPGRSGSACRSPG